MVKKLEMKFDPRTIEHLGVRMYSTLPPALAELISNAFDADASTVSLRFHEQNGKPVSINVSDDGCGMTAEDIQDKFLVVGRNRRKQDGDEPTKKFSRLPTGKKGLGKLALFGLAKLVTVDAVKNGLRNRFILDWVALMNADGSYRPQSELVDQETTKPSGTTITLSMLKRQSSFDVEGLADSLSKIFIVDKDFSILLIDSAGNKLQVDNNRRYSQFNQEFDWDVDDLVEDDSKFKGKICGKIYTAETPIKPNSGLRGISIFSRSKLVNAPEFFSNSASSHFFQYLTGWIKADFIDLLDEDVISTNRQSINWDNEEMSEFRDYLSTLVSRVNSSWREKRKEKKVFDLQERTGIDTAHWLSTMPDDAQANVGLILDLLNSDEAIGKISPVVEVLHRIVPEYPQLHWRYLNPNLRDRIKSLYEQRQYGFAAEQGVKIYCEQIRVLTGRLEDGSDLTSRAFSANKPYIEISSPSTETGRNLQSGQEHLSRGLISGFRNPISHAPMDSIVPSVFTDLDCLNVLSLISYLMGKVDKGKVVK